MERVRFTYAEGDTITEMRNWLHGHPLADAGDVRLVWASESDLCLAGEEVRKKTPEERVDEIMREHFGKPSYCLPDVQAELLRLYSEIYKSAD